VQHQACHSLRPARRVLQRDGRAQADTADIVIGETETLDEVAQELSVAGHREGRRPSGRLAATREIRNQHPAMAGEGRAPGMKVLQRPNEAMTEKQRLARSLVEVSDLPLPDVDEPDMLGAERRSYSPVSICARCSRPL
jgi:hypothetical protein